MWFARLFSGQGEHERLGRLLDLLRKNGVTAYESDGLKLELARLEPPRAEVPMPPQREPSDDEILFGRSIEELRREGLIAGG